MRALPLNPTRSLRWVFSYFRHKVGEVKGEETELKLVPQTCLSSTCAVLSYCDLGNVC